MKNKFLVTLTAFLFAGIAAFAQQAPSKPVKIGFVSVNYILQQMPESQQIQAELQEYEQQLSNRLRSQYEQFQQQAQTYSQSRGTMTEEARQKRESELQEMQAALQQSQMGAQQMIQQKESDLLAPAYDKIQNSIDEVAKENGFTHILNSEVGGIPTLLYLAEESDDISMMVLQKMGVNPQQQQQQQTQQQGNR